MRPRLLVLVVAAFALVAPLTPALAQEGRRFPNPATDIRKDTPNDPKFDCSEPDDEDRATVPRCPSIYNAQLDLWGFGPASTSATAVHREGPRRGQPMRSGISADRAWKTTIGRPDVTIAILDTGILWRTESLRRQIALNSGELPAVSDADGDGVLSVGDFEGLVSPSLGKDGDPTKVDAQDLIAAYSDGVDSDGNGYVDDIAGWDFFDDDNDAFDASSYSSASNHGNGRANDAAEQGNDGTGGIGTCPECSILPVRVWDTFVVGGDNYAMGAAYAADAGAAVIEVALGALSNSPSAQAATRYAYDKGTTLAVVSSDLNTANHNYPTNYAETIEVNGVVPDTQGVAAGDANEFNLPNAGSVPAPAPVGTYFRNSNLTQYGAHVHVGAVGTTGSIATGKASGAFGLVIAAGRERADAIGGPLTPDEVKQIVTLSAEDVRPLDTLGLGAPDPAKEGFDERFGYGRLDVGAAVQRVVPGKIPPSVLFRTPRWWQIVDPAKEPVLPIVADSGSRAPSHTVVVEAARGVEPSDGEFRKVLTTGTLTGRQDARNLGSVRTSDLTALFPAGTDFSRPPLLDVNEYAVTIRAKVTDSLGNVGEDRRVVWLRSDPTLLPGFPQFTDRGGESSARLADLDGDAKLEIVLADSGGRTRVLGRDGKDVPFWNGGQGVLAPVLQEAAPHAGAAAYRAGVPLPRGVSFTPAVADLDGDGALEVVVTSSGGTITVYDRFGSVIRTLSVDRSLSAPPLRSKAYHVKTGFFGTASIGEIDPTSPGLVIVAGGLDGRVYVWRLDGSLVPGFPRSLNTRDTGTNRAGAELITAPTLTQLDKDAPMEIVVAGSEVVAGSGGSEAPGADPTDLATAYRTIVNRVLGRAIGNKASLVHALQGDGTNAAGWPVRLDGPLPDVLPLVGPAHQVAAADVGGPQGSPLKDGIDEVVLSSTTGEVVTFNADGKRRHTHSSEVTPASDPRITDRSKVLNLFEYASIGDLEGAGALSAFKGGLTLGGLVNLALVGQNVPQDHVVQGWELGTGTYRPGWPVQVEDYTLLSQPAIADADGLPGKEVVQGTGLYLVHAFNAAGREAPGFPKFTGGWNYATPAFGDLDGDGKLEMVSSTREGYLFAWSLDGRADGNQEWWGALHDERSTSRYGTDTRPPARVQNLTRQGTSVTWRPTGDDWLVGKPIKTVVVVDGTARDLAGDAIVANGIARTSRVEVFAVDDAGNRSLGAVLLPEQEAPVVAPTAAPPGSASPTQTAAPPGSASPTQTAAPSGSASPTPTGTGSPTATPSAGASTSPARRPNGAGFRRLTPTRLLDTRTEGGAVRADADRLVDVRGRAGIPSSGVTAVVVNATVTGVAQSMDLMVYPSDRRPAPRTSNLNAVPGQTVANLVEVAVGQDGRIGLSVSQGSSHVVLDVVGWYGEDGAGGDGFVSQAPERRFDSRESAPIAAGDDRVVPLFAQVPSGVSSAVVSVTALGTQANADVQLYGAGDRPARRTSNLNLRRGDTVANLAVVPVDEQGRVAISVSQGSAQVVLDLVGWYAPDSARGFVPLRPARVFDSRDEQNPVAAGADREVVVAGAGGVPTTGVEAVLVNVTSVGSTDTADLQVYPAGARPARRTSNLNVRAGQTVPVLVAVKVGRDGRVALSTSQGSTHVVLDVVGYVRTAQ